MFEAIRYHLTHLTDPSGRDSRQTFWFHVLFLVLLHVGVSLAASIPMYLSMFGQAFDAAQSGADQADMMASMFSDVADQLRIQMWVSVTLEIVMIGLFLAAFVRRLHDTGFSGWIAAIPVATQLASAGWNLANFDHIMTVMEGAMASVDSHQAAVLQNEIGVFGMIGWTGYLVVIGFGILKSQDGPNRYGAEPVRF